MKKKKKANSWELCSEDLVSQYTSTNKTVIFFKK